MILEANLAIICGLTIIIQKHNFDGRKFKLQMSGLHCIYKLKILPKNPFFKVLLF